MNAQASDLRMQANENLSIFPAQHRPKLENQILPAEPLADFQPSFQDTGGTPMLLFARPQGHARRRTQSIIGVSPVSPIPAKGRRFASLSGQAIAIAGAGRQKSFSLSHLKLR
jgi:hypothetical protein